MPCDRFKTQFHEGKTQFLPLAAAPPLDAAPPLEAELPLVVPPFAATFTATFAVAAFGGIFLSFEAFVMQVLGQGPITKDVFCPPGFKVWPSCRTNSKVFEKLSCSCGGKLGKCSPIKDRKSQSSS